MRFSTMAALMLTVAAAAGTLDAALFQLRIGRAAAVIFAVAAAAVRPAVLEFSPEFELCPACALIPALLLIPALRQEGRRTLWALPAALLIALPAFLLSRRLSGDAFIILSALLPLFAAPFIKPLSLRLLAAALAPLFLALLLFLADLASSGYGAFSAAGETLDLQLTGMAFSALFFALRTPLPKASAS